MSPLVEGEVVFPILFFRFSVLTGKLSPKLSFIFVWRGFGTTALDLLSNI
jgi:hypothetical protein